MLISNIKYWLAFWLNKSLKILAFSKKSVTNFPLTNNEEINGTSLTSTNVLSIDQYVFAKIDGSNNSADKQT